MKIKKLLTAAAVLCFSLTSYTSASASTSNKAIKDVADKCVAYTKVDNICATIPEFKSYYKKYKVRVLQRVGKGNWYFNLADEIEAAKELMLQKLLLHEAEKNNIEKTKWFKNYLPDIQDAKKEVKNWVKQQVKAGKIPPSKAKLVEKRLIERAVNGYKVKAYLDMVLKDAIRVTRDDLENFLSAHKGEYGLTPDPENPTLKVINKRELVEAIRQEKKQVAAAQLADELFKSYGVKINVNLLRKLSKVVNAGQHFKTKDTK